MVRQQVRLGVSLQAVRQEDEGGVRGDVGVVVARLMPRR